MPDTYLVTYNATGAAGNPAVEIIRTVTVQPMGSEGEGEGSPCVQGPFYNAGLDQDNMLSLSEVLCVVQFATAAGCTVTRRSRPAKKASLTGPGDGSCCPHDGDYLPNGADWRFVDWRLALAELMRCIQFFNIGGYTSCPSTGTEDGYCPRAP